MADFINLPGELIVVMTDEEFRELGAILPAMPRPNQITEYLQDRYNDWLYGQIKKRISQ